MNRASAVALAAVLLTACGTPEQVGELDLHATWIQQPEGAELQLSVSPSAVAGRPDLLPLRSPMWEVSGAEPLNLNGVSDVRFRPDGGLVLADPPGRQVLLLDNDGRLEGRVGREGDGPGEFRRPSVVLPVGSGLLVWQPGQPAAFSLFGAEGDFIDSAPTSVEGDWVTPFLRRLPAGGVNWVQGPEDLTRRFRAWGKDSFLHLLEEDERSMTPSADPAQLPSSLHARRAHLIRYGLDLMIQDTVAHLDAIPLHPGEPQFDGFRYWWEPLFPARNLFATGDGWLALGHGDSASVRILWNDPGEGARRVRWPLEVRPLMDDDVERVLEWDLSSALRDDRPFERMWERESRPGRRRILEAFREDYGRHVAQQAPQATALFGAGECLFLAGFRPEDHRSGTAASLVAVNLRTGSVASIRLQGSGERLADVSMDRIVATARDSMGEWLIRSYEHGVECG